MNEQRIDAALRVVVARLIEVNRQLVSQDNVTEATLRLGLEVGRLADHVGFSQWYYGTAVPSDDGGE